MNKYALLDWIKSRRLEHLYAAQNPHIDDRSRGYHQGWDEAMREVRLQVLSLPEDERKPA